MSVHQSAGLLMCRKSDQQLEFFLVHPGGPFFKNKTAGVWSIPKGLPEGNEDLLSAAQREFQEETGLSSKPPFFPLGSIQQKGGKIVHAWAFFGEWNPDDGIHSNTFSIEWPPKSGRMQEFPEQDQAAWLNFDDARARINPAQVPLLERALAVCVEK
jgi:predicted NUDIX family NTP pyrophosphohydrolase